MDPESQKAARPTREKKPEAEPDPLDDGQAEELSELKELLIDADGVSQVLSQAVSISTASDDQLARALRPTIEQSLEDSTRRNPGMLAEAIFPVLGPAIRRSINETFDSLVQSLQTTLEHSMSSQGWKWRFEAWRTGRPFAEVVLSHTLLYKVEAVFLIHKETGVLLHHVKGKAGVVKDEDMVSGMLTAIQDFVGDSFEGDRGDKLRTMQVGDRSVWIEDSPRMSLAAVITGRCPVEYRQSLRETLEQIELGYAKVLKNFSGDVAVFGGTEPLLENCLKSESAVEKKKSGSPVMAYAVLLVMFLGLATYIGFRMFEGSRWDAMVTELKVEEGLIVLDAVQDGEGSYVIGMRDSFARDPLEVLRKHGYTKDTVQMKWEPYVSYDPDLILRRARARLKPPEDVRLYYQGGVLTAMGEADETWVEMARLKAVWIPGVDSFTRGQEKRVDLLSVAIGRIHNTVLELEGEFQMKPGQEARFAALVPAVKLVVGSNTSNDVRRGILLRGQGATDYQVVQSFTRSLVAAEVLRDLLLEQGVDGRFLSIDKSESPVRSGTPLPERGKDAGTLTVSFTVVELTER